MSSSFSQQTTWLRLWGLGPLDAVFAGLLPDNSRRLRTWLMVWPMAGITDGCHSCYSFICFIGLICIATGSSWTQCVCASLSEGQQIARLADLPSHKQNPSVAFLPSVFVSVPAT
jgi:hypothetical protein